jgi:hypothetical protein
MISPPRPTQSGETAALSSKKREALGETEAPCEQEKGGVHEEENQSLV